MGPVLSMNTPHSIMTQQTALENFISLLNLQEGQMIGKKHGGEVLSKLMQEF